MNLQVVLVTNKQLHHKYWISKMMESNNIAGIIHPQNTNNIKIPAKGTLLNIWSLISKIMAQLFYKISKTNSRIEFSKESVNWFSNSIEAYEKLIYEVNKVNSPEAIKIINQLEADIIYFLGGDIAESKFINSAKKVCLNFHSGLSPIYNGNKSYLWRMIENRPNLVGGTLMRMNEKIDGGDIISHFLPSINKNDNASTLFMKMIQGSIELYTIVIKKMDQ